MGFEELLRRRLGPMAELVARGHRPEHPAPDPAALWYRRAAGLELRFRPEESWAEVEVGRVDAQERTRVELSKARVALGLTEWRAAVDLPLDPKALWRLVEAGLLYWSRTPPERRLQGAAGALQGGQKIARRGSCWPTGAVETAIEIAPMPFMPRAKDLVGAKWVGARFAVLERGHEVLGCTITGSERLGRLIRGLLPLLDGRQAPAEIIGSFDKGDRHEVEKLLGLLDLSTLLEAVEGPPEPGPALDRVASPQVTWLGHGGVLIQSASTNVIVDPIFYAKSDPEERWLSAPKFDPRALPRLDAILITHGDNDHLNPNALAQLSRDVPVIVPSLDRPPRAYQVDLRGMLSLLGFRQIVELDPWEQLRIGDLSITACPFEGESWDLELPKATYLVESGAFSVFCSADAAPMDEVYRELKGRGRTIDLAFMGVSGNAEAFLMPAELGYGNFYAEAIPKIRHQEWVQHCAGPAEAAASLKLFEPRFAFGYAAGGASFIRTSYSDEGDHDRLATLLLDSGAQTRPVALPLGTPVPLSALGERPTHISPRTVASQL